MAESLEQYYAEDEAAFAAEQASVERGICPRCASKLPPEQENVIACAKCLWKQQRIVWE